MKSAGSRTMRRPPPPPARPDAGRVLGPGQRRWPGCPAGPGRTDARTPTERTCRSAPRSRRSGGSACSPKASRDSRANSWSSTPLAQPAGASRRERQSSAVPLDVARHPRRRRSQVTKRRQVVRGLRPQEVAQLVVVDGVRGARVVQPRSSCSASRSSATDAGQLREGSLETAAIPRPGTGCGRRARRAAAGPGWTRAAPGPSAGGRPGAGRPSSSRARRAGRATASASATASPPSAPPAARRHRRACCAPGKKAPWRARKSSTSSWAGSSPASRRPSNESRSRTISRLAASCSGRGVPDGVRHALRSCGVEHLSLQPRDSAR